MLKFGFWRFLLIASWHRWIVITFLLFRWTGRVVNFTGSFMLTWWRMSLFIGARVLFMMIWVFALIFARDFMPFITNFIAIMLNFMFAACKKLKYMLVFQNRSNAANKQLHRFNKMSSVCIPRSVVAILFAMLRTTTFMPIVIGHSTINSLIMLLSFLWAIATATASIVVWVWFMLMFWMCWVVLSIFGWILFNENKKKWFQFGNIRRWLGFEYNRL